MATPWNRPIPTGRNLGLPISPPRTRSSGKTPQDFQAEADRMEEARDLADPDYRESQEKPRNRYSIESQTTPRKRSATDDISPRSAKKNSPGHKTFDKLKDRGSKTERKRHFAQIRKNWGRDTEQWMPESVWPCRFSRSGNRKIRRLIEDPRDWNSPLLEELSYLSVVTKNQPGVAFQALEDAVSHRQEQEGSNEETQVLKEDVQLATRICKGEEPDDAAPGPAPPDEDDAAAEEMDTDAPADEAARGLPDPRSPTFAADETVIKVENQAARMSIAAERVADGAWTGYDDEMEKLEEARLEAEENEAVAAARRARREEIAQRRRIRELMRLHGRSREDAIRLGSDEAGL